MNKLARSYVEYAKRDLKLAKYALADYKDDMMVSLAAYHCQQAIEKSIKSLFLENKMELIKTHDIRILLDKLRMDEISVEMFRHIEEYSDTITSWECGTRYTAGLLCSVKLIESVIKLADAIVVELSNLTLDKCTVKEEYRARRIDKIK